MAGITIGVYCSPEFWVTARSARRRDATLHGYRVVRKTTGPQVPCSPFGYSSTVALTSSFGLQFPSIVEIQSD